MSRLTRAQARSLAKKHLGRHWHYLTKIEKTRVINDVIKSYNQGFEAGGAHNDN